MSISCLRCRKTLTSQSFTHFCREHCEHCGGSWYAQGQMASAIRHSEEEAAESDRYESIDEGNCLVCKKALQGQEYAHDSGETILKCPDGCGTWLDAGQLQRIRAYQEGSGAVNLLAEAMHQELDWQNRRSLFSRVIASRIGITIAVIAMIACAGLLTASVEVACIFAFRLVVPFCLVFFSGQLGNVLTCHGGIWATKPSEELVPGALAIAGWIMMGALFIAMVYAARAHASGFETTRF